MKKWYLLLGAVLMVACNRGRDEESRTITLSHISPEDAMGLVRPHVSAETRVSISEQPPALTLQGPIGNVDQISDLVRRFDRPAPNVELRFQIIEADGFTNADPAIADVEAVLRDLFRFQGYRLVGESMVRSEAPGMVAQQLVGEGGRPFQIRAQLKRVLQSDTAKAVSLEVTLLQFGDAVLGTTLTVPSGQTVVVGTAPSSRERNTLILVVRPTIQ